MEGREFHKNINNILLFDQSFFGSNNEIWGTKCRPFLLILEILNENIVETKQYNIFKTGCAVLGNNKNVKQGGLEARLKQYQTFTLLAT